LLGVLLVALLHWPFNLAALEPFDAYLFRIAGWASLSVAAVGLIAAWFVPMAYCRYGCPTGALLNFLRFHGHSDRVSRQDLAATALVLLALAIRVWFR
jgi:NosR/NirI family transcriptional regulator, nitrous oxide reductase regulator